MQTCFGFSLTYFFWGGWQQRAYIILCSCLTVQQFCEMRMCTTHNHFYSPVLLPLFQKSLYLMKLLKNWCVFFCCDNREKQLHFCGSPLHGRITTKHSGNSITELLQIRKVGREKTRSGGSRATSQDYPQSLSLYYVAAQSRLFKEYNLHKRQNLS